MLPITLPALAYMPLHVCVSVCKYVYANKFILLCQQPATLRTSLCPQRNSHTLSTLNLHRSYEYNGAYGAPQRRIGAATAYLNIYKSRVGPQNDDFVEIASARL